MYRLESGPRSTPVLDRPPQAKAFIEGSIHQPSLIGSFPHLDAWLEVVGRAETSVPLRKGFALVAEDVYRKLESEATKQIAGFVAYSCSIIIDKLGAPDNGFSLSFIERMRDFIDTAQGGLVPQDQMTRKDAEVFINEALNFISDLPNAKDDLLEIRKKVIEFMFGFYHELNRDNNLTIQGGMALFGLALSKRTFTDHKEVRAKLIETAKKDPTAWKIYRAFERDLFGGKAYEPEDNNLDFSGTYI